MLYLDKLNQLKKRYQLLESKLADPAVLNDAQKNAATQKEFHELKNIIAKIEKLNELEKNIAENKLILEGEENQ